MPGFVRYARSMKRLTLVIALAACGSVPPATSPAAPQPDCAGVVAATEKLVAADHTSADERERAKSVVALRCVEDHWPTVATSCISAAADLAGAHACVREHLTVAQHERLMQALKSAPTEKVVDETPVMLEPEAAPIPSSGGQAAIAAKLNEEGKKLFSNKAFADSSMKFREAVSRVPEPRYFFSLCLSLYQEGKFSEALVACHAGEKTDPDPRLRQKLEKATDMIVREAKAQGVNVLE